jgi:hypothetical protein
MFIDRFPLQQQGVRLLGITHRGIDLNLRWSNIHNDPQIRGIAAYRFPFAQAGATDRDDPEAVTPLRLRIRREIQVDAHGGPMRFVLAPFDPGAAIIPRDPQIQAAQSGRASGFHFVGQVEGQVVDHGGTRLLHMGCPETA